MVMMLLLDGLVGSKACPSEAPPPVVRSYRDLYGHLAFEDKQCPEIDHLLACLMDMNYFPLIMQLANFRHRTTNCTRSRLAFSDRYLMAIHPRDMATSSYPARVLYDGQVV